MGQCRGEGSVSAPTATGPHPVQNFRKATLKSEERQSTKPGWKHKLSRHERGYGAVWDKLRKEVMQRDNGLCQPCLRNGRVTPAHAVDHIVQKAAGGTDDLTNLQSICRACHLDKTMTDNGRRKRVTIGPDGWAVEALHG